MCFRSSHLHAAVAHSKISVNWASKKNSGGLPGGSIRRQVFVGAIRAVERRPGGGRLPVGVGGAIKNYWCDQLVGHRKDIRWVGIRMVQFPGSCSQARLLQIIDALDR